MSGEEVNKEKKVNKVVGWYNNSKHFKGVVESTINRVNNAHDSLNSCEEKNKVFNFCRDVWGVFKSSKGFIDAIKEIGKPVSIGKKVGSFVGAGVGAGVGFLAGAGVGAGVGSFVGSFVGAGVGGVVSAVKLIKNYRELKDKAKQALIAKDASKILSKTDLMDKKSVKDSMNDMFARVGICSYSEGKDILDAIKYAEDYRVGVGFKEPPEERLNNPVFKNAYTTLINIRRLYNEKFEDYSSFLRNAYSSTTSLKSLKHNLYNYKSLLEKTLEDLTGSKELIECSLQELGECLCGSESEKNIVDVIHDSIACLERSEMSVRISINSIDDYIKNNLLC